MTEIYAMYEALDNMDDYALMANVKPVGPHKVLTDAIAELEQLRQRVAEQLETIKALNSCIGGEGSTTTENLIRVSRLEQRVAELENEAKQLRDLQYELMRSGALVAIEKCKNATGQRRVIDMYVSANQIAEDLLNAMDSGA